MSRAARPALVLLIAATAVCTALLGGCMSKPAPVLSQQQLQAGVIGEKHPVNQAQATKMGCSCHTEAAKKAASGK